jgi:hypothetical protein
VIRSGYHTIPNRSLVKSEMGWCRLISRGRPSPNGTRPMVKAHTIDRIVLVKPADVSDGRLRKSPWPADWLCNCSG